MEIIRSDEFQRMGREAEELLATEENLSPEKQADLELKVEQTGIHRNVKDRVSMTLDVVIEGGPESAAAFVETANIRSGTRQAFIDIGTLAPANDNFAFHAGKHELNHVISGFTEIDLRKNLKPEQLRILLTKLGTMNTDPVYWLEGFNELKTINEIGADPNCGYNDDEVPAARRLEMLAINTTGQSLLAAYKASNQELFYDRLRELCDALLIDKIRSDLGITTNTSKTPESSDLPLAA